MNCFALDVETTTRTKGNPFDSTNKFVLGAIGTDTSYINFTVDNWREQIQEYINNTRLVILFNGKFDLHWMRNLGMDIDPRLPIWDCQLAEFILENQRNPYPSLEGTAQKYGVGHKLDIVKTEYWDKGIDTDKIPFNILDEYLKQDISVTYKVYLKQVEEFKKPEHRGKYNLFRMQCYDILALEDMEYNGFLFDVENAKKKSDILNQQREEIERELLGLFPDIPINIGSGDHVSCMLYGGTITEEYRIPIGEYKTGAKVGQTRFKLAYQEYVLPRIVEPLPNSNLSKEGYFATDEPTLKNLKPDKKVKRIIDLLLERRGLEKLRGTYYDGIPKMIEEKCWKGNIVHGNLNQCVARTSRLSATQPNQQNMPGDCKRLCITRY